MQVAKPTNFDLMDKEIYGFCSRYIGHVKVSWETCLVQIDRTSREFNISS